MTTNVRRFAASLALIIVLLGTPVIAGPRDGGAERDRVSIVRIVKRVVQRLFGISPLHTPVGPIPAPSTTT
jgi:hypothetical protein